MWMWSINLGGDAVPPRNFAELWVMLYKDRGYFTIVGHVVKYLVKEVDELRATGVVDSLGYGNMAYQPKNLGE